MTAVSMKSSKSSRSGRQPPQRHDGRAVLESFARELDDASAGRVATRTAAAPEGSSAALTVSLDGKDFATFGVLDATYYWTFDGGESCHYAKDEAVMKRFLRVELSGAIARAGSNA
jgi:hypothetical protein